jgi:hypothetical protein
MSTDVSEGPSSLKETLKPEVVYVTKMPVKLPRLHCNLGRLLAYFPLVIV